MPIPSVLYLLGISKQNSIKVINEKNQPIAFANISINNTNFGTITNADGFFEISIDETMKNNHLLISSIGYQHVHYPIDSLIQIKTDTSIILKLKEKSYLIDEITVNKQTIPSPKEIIDSAILKIPQFLSQDASIGEYYFRQSHWNDTAMNRLIQAAISIYDPGIKSPIESCQINVDELQTSLDNRSIDYKNLLSFYKYKNDNLNPSINSTSSYNDPGVQNILIDHFDSQNASMNHFFIKANMIRGYQEGKRPYKKIFTKDIKQRPLLTTESFTKEHDFKLDSILLYGNESVFKIKILPNKKYPKIKYQEDGLIPIGIAYIRARDYALLGLEYSYIQNPSHKHYSWSLPVYFKYEVRFKEVESKLHLNYLSYSRRDYNTQLLLEEHKIKSDIVKQELINTNIITTKTIVDKIKAETKWNANHYQERPYNGEFWKTYSTFMETQEQKHLRENMEAQALN